MACKAGNGFGKIVGEPMIMMITIPITINHLGFINSIICRMNEIFETLIINNY